MTRRLVFVAAFSFCLSAQGQKPTPPSATGETLLHPLTITIGDQLHPPSSATAQEFTVKSVGLQIEQKRASEAAATELPGLWRASFWQYLPASSGRTLNSPIAGEDDSVLTPGYLRFPTRQLERKVIASDRTMELLFSR